MPQLLPDLSPPDYLSSASIEPAAIVRPAAGPSPNQYDPKQALVDAAVASLTDGIDTLLGWMRDLASLGDDEADAPAPEAVRNALILLRDRREEVLRLPEGERLLPFTGVAVGRSGSIILEFERGQLALSAVVQADGWIERRMFVSSRLHSREKSRLDLSRSTTLLFGDAPVALEVNWNRTLRLNLTRQFFGGYRSSEEWTRP